MEQDLSPRTGDPFTAAQVETDAAVDDVFAEFTESTPEEVMALDDGSRESTRTDRSVEWLAFEVPERVQPVDPAGENRVDGPSMDELFGEQQR